MARLVPTAIVRAGVVSELEVEEDEEVDAEDADGNDGGVETGVDTFGFGTAVRSPATTLTFDTMFLADNEGSEEDDDDAADDIDVPDSLVFRCSSSIFFSSALCCTNCHFPRRRS